MTEGRQHQERPQLFVVRLWSESFDQGQRVWRGEVVQPGGDRGRFFARWEDLLVFLCEAVEVPWEGRVDIEITTEVIDREGD